MLLSTLKKQLQQLDSIAFKLEDNTYVLSHFHVTEIGLVTKKFIDCGGKLREEKAINFQLWDAEDSDHRLKAEKLLAIIALSENALQLPDLDIEIEYQGTTIGRYGLDFDGTDFILLSKKTACLAMDSCGTPDKTKRNLNTLQTACCAPGGGCC